MLRRSLARAVVLVLLAGLGTDSLAGSPKKPVGPDIDAHNKTVQRGIEYLITTGQASDGSFSKSMGCGPTSLAVTAMLRNGRSPEDPAVAKGLKYLESCVRPDGGIYSEGSFFGNYETCAAMMCFQEANRSVRYKALLEKAERYIRGNQWDEEKQKEKSDLSFGGVGYGGKSRPDLSNTAFLVDALKSCGAGPEDEAIQNALVFVSRCQNLETEHNTTRFAAKVNDGGFYYTCVVDRQDEGRMTPNGGLRSYGSMTYSGLKSMIYAGLKEDDPRVKAAVGWVRKYYDLKNNPGMGSAGLYYYYHLFAKALDALGEDLIEDGKGVKHDWRREVVEELARRQRPNGSWVNTTTRWMEGDPNLVTAYSLLALSHCRPKATGKKP